MKRVVSGSTRLLIMVGLVSCLWTFFFFYFGSMEKDGVIESEPTPIEYCFFIAGYPDCGYYHRAREAANDLMSIQPFANRSPPIHFSFQSKEIARGLAWDDFRSELYSKRFPEASNHRTSPIIYYDRCDGKDKGVFIGGYDKFKQFFDQEDVIFDY